MAGLQDICPMVSALMVRRRVWQPIRGGSQSGLHACVAGTDYDDVVFLWINEHSY